MAPELIEFNYTRYLRIIGTYHALNNADRARLELLIDHASFVALEWDQQRQGDVDITLMAEPFREKASYDTNTHTIVSGCLNSLYLLAFLRGNERQIRLANEGKSPDDPRDTEASEFDFCYTLAQSKGKAVYLVDLPRSEQLLALSSLPARAKLRHFSSFLALAPRPKQAEEIICQRREDHMFRRIEEEEGCSLEDLTRAGILVVGTAHAINYRKRIEK